MRKSKMMSLTKQGNYLPFTEDMSQSALVSKLNDWQFKYMQLNNYCADLHTEIEKLKKEIDNLKKKK